MRFQARFAVLLTLLVVMVLLVGLVWIGLAGRRPSQPSTNVGAVPVIYVQQPPSDVWHALDWSGRIRSGISIRQVGNPYQSPDGSRLLWPQQDSSAIADANGKVISKVDLSLTRGLAWADDNSGICVINVVNQQPDGSGTFQLLFQPVVGDSRPITALSLTAGPNVSACSPGGGRVVITTASGHGDLGNLKVLFHELIVVDFRSGAQIAKRTFPSSRQGVVSSIVVSHDGSVAALGSDAGTSLLDVTKDQLASGPNGITPVAFSWNDVLLVGDDSSNHGLILNSKTGEVIWRDQSNRVTQGAAANPDTSDMMLFTTTGELTDLLVVAPNGHAQMIATEVFPAQAVPCNSCSAV